MVNKRVPEVRFEGFSGEWEKRSFQDFTKLSQGLQIAIDKRHLVPGKNRMFYITNEFLNPNSDKRYYIESPSKSVIAKEEDILMTRTGNTGKVVTNVEGAFHNNFFRIAYNNKETAKLFLYYLLNSSPIQKEILVRAGTSTIPDLNHNDFYKIKVNTPQYEEQTQVGNFFNQLDDTIALHQQELTTLKQTKQGFLQKMFPKEGESVPEVRFPGFTGDWEQHKLDSIVDRVKSYSLSRDVETTEYTGYKYIHYGDIHTKVADIIDEFSDLPNIKAGNYELLKKGDLVLADASEDYQGIAAPAVITIDVPFKLVSGLHTIALRPKQIDSLFLYYLINSQTFRKYGYKAGTGMKVFGISATNLLRFESLFPTFEEQTKIGNFFKQLDDTIALHQRELDALKETKKAFLQKMFV